MTKVKPPTNQLEQLRQSAHAAEAQLIQDAFLAKGGKWQAAADYLGCSVSSLQRAVARHPELMQLRNNLRDRVNPDPPPGYTVIRQPQTFQVLVSKKRA
jgi:hypothetical protein